MKIFEQQIAEKVKEYFQSEKVQDFLTKAEDKGNGTFEVIASTQTKDRHGEVVIQEGIDVKNFKKNPVILFGHNSWDLPIGKATSVKKEKNRLIIKGVFASEESNPFAQQVRKLYDEGIMKAVSIGFISKERAENDWRQITKSELLELSFVPIPANPQALAKMQEKGMTDINLSLLEFEAKDVDPKNMEKVTKKDGGDDEDEEKAKAEAKKAEKLENLKTVIGEMMEEKIGGLCARVEAIEECANKKVQETEQKDFMEALNKKALQSINKWSRDVLTDIKRREA